MTDVRAAGNMCSTADRVFEFSSSATEVENSNKGNASDATSMNNGSGVTSWQETRRQWVGIRNHRRRQRAPEDPIISWSMTYEELLWTGNVFDKPIPLSEMVDFLVDIWQDEGLYD